MNFAIIGRVSRVLTARTRNVKRYKRFLTETNEPHLPSFIAEPDKPGVIEPEFDVEPDELGVTNNPFLVPLTVQTLTTPIVKFLSHYNMDAKEFGDICQDAPDIIAGMAENIELSLSSLFHDNSAEFQLQPSTALFAPQWSTEEQIGDELRKIRESEVCHCKWYYSDPWRDTSKAESDVHNPYRDMIAVIGAAGANSDDCIRIGFGYWSQGCTELLDQVIGKMKANPTITCKMTIGVEGQIAYGRDELLPQIKTMREAFGRRFDVRRVYGTGHNRIHHWQYIGVGHYTFIGSPNPGSASKDKNQEIAVAIHHPNYTQNAISERFDYFFSANVNKDESKKVQIPQYVKALNINKY